VAEAAESGLIDNATVDRAWTRCGNHLGRLAPAAWRGGLLRPRGRYWIWARSLLSGAASPLAGALGLPAPPWPSCQPSASRLRLGLRGLADSLDTLPDAL
jgi:hypothetical protein